MVTLYYTKHHHQNLLRTESLIIQHKQMVKVKGNTLLKYKMTEIL